MHFTSLLPLVGLAALTGAVPVSDAAGDFTNEKWDVIVVGSGPAGIISATRMAQAGKKTLLLEAGGPSYGRTGGTNRPSWLDGTKLSRVDVPGLYSSIFDSSTNPGDLLCGGQTNAFGGCTIGGSSAVNAGLFFQPPASDFDLYFPQGWKSKDVQSAIQKLKKQQPSTSKPSQDGRPYNQNTFKAAEKWLVGGGAGYSEVNINEKANNKTKVFGHTIYDYINAQRAGPVVTYLPDALKLKNFAIRHGVRVDHIARNGNEATGVVAIVNGQSVNINLNNGGRIISSGGALQSPALLMRSAIGDPATLQQLAQAGRLNSFPKSSWINNTHVGAGLFDNPNTFIELTGNDVNSYTYSYNPPQADETKWLKQRSGDLSFAGQTAVFWDKVKHADGSFAVCQGTIGTSGFDQYTGPNTMTLNVYGTSGLASSGKVVLDPNNNFIPGPNNNVYYSNPRDAQDIATFIHRIFAALPKAGLTPNNMQQSWSVQQIASYITNPQNQPYARGMVNHWSSSCRFGKCVDTDAKVVGMKNLHVVDGSIIAPLSVNPQMGIMITAEHAAQRILALD